MPAAPQSVLITTGDGVIHVGWAASLDAVTSYTVYYQVTDSSGSPLSLTPTPATATSATIEGLVNGTAYSVWVTATADGTESDSSDVQNNVIPLGAPTQPGLAAAHGPAAGQLTFTITPPSDYGDSANNLAALTYRLYEDAGALPFMTDISETTLVVGPSDLTMGVSTDFTVVATNGPGVSAPSDAVTITPLGAPDAPTISVDLSSGVTLHITPPANLGGDSSVTYNLWSLNVSDASLNALFATGISVTTYEILDLSENTDYYFAVTASNSGFTSDLSNTVSAQPLTKPATPSISVSAGDQIVTVNVTYTDIGSGELFTDLSFNLYQDGTLILSQSNNPLFATTDVSNGSTYSYTATIANALFTSDPSVAQTATPVATPGRPQNLVLDPSDSEIHITFDRPSNVDISATLIYNIYRDSEVITSSPNTSFIDAGLSNGQMYNYSITAVNEINIEGYATIGTSMPLGTPDAPTISAAAINGVITLTLTPPIIDGRGDNEVPVSLQYDIYIDSSSTPIVTGLTTTTYEVDPAITTFGTPYTFAAKAINEASTSALSEASSPVILYGKPGVPIVRIKARDGSVKLNITPPVNKGGDISVSYTIVKGADTLVLADPTGEYEYIDSDVVNGSIYTYVILASNSSTTSDSVTVSAKPMATPEAPVVDYELTSSQMVLTITPPTNNVGVISYRYTIYAGDNILKVVPGASPTDQTVVTLPTVNGQAYNVYVIASTIVADGQSSPIREIVTYGTPGPTSVIADASDGFVTLTMTNNDTGGGPVTYTITRAEGAEYANVTLITYNNPATTYVDDNLVNGTLYYYSVIAANAAMYSAFATDMAAVPLRAPVLGGLVAAVDPTVSQRVKLTVTITDIGYDISSGPLLTYEFTRGTTVVTADPSGNGVWILDDEPVNSISYTVTATNQNGLFASASSNAVTPLIYATVNGTKATVAVVDPTIFDIATVTKDTAVAVNTGTAEAPVYVTAIVTDIAGEVYNSGAANAVLVEAMQTAIDSGISSMLVKRIFPGDTAPTNSLIELGTPAAPLISATAGGAKSTTLDLPAATYADGSPLPPNKTVVACDITPRTDGQPGAYILVKVDVSGVALTDGFSIPITIRDDTAPGLTGYPLFHFVDGAWKILVTLPPDLTDPSGCTYSGILTENQDYAGLTPPADVPGAPAKPTTVAHVGAITVNYSAPAHIGGSAITSYRVYWSGANATSGDITTSGPVTTATVTNLLANTNYTFVVAAINADGEGPDSLPSDPIQTATPPPPPPICFMANAPVLTPRGYRRIDSLKAGDLVRLADGCSMEIKAVKVVRYQPSPEVNPFVIPKGTFGAKERLLISPSHRVSVPGRGMVEARNLGLKQWTMHEAFDYYNLELEKWENMVVAGVEVESLAPILRTTITTEQFKQLLRAKYGARASDPELLSKIPSSCWPVGNGLVSIPYIKR